MALIPSACAAFTAGDQIIGFFMTKQTVVGTVWVKRRDRNARVLNVERRELVVDLLYTGQYALFVGVVTGIFQRHVAADKEHAQVVHMEHCQTVIGTRFDW